MSSPYPILDNRPIDNWKVTELKEELKRRKLTTKGLKEDLVKRLAEAVLIEREKEEALRIENENDVKNGDNGVDSVPDPVVGVEVSDTDTSHTETAKNIADCDDVQNVEADNVAVKVGINDSVAALGQEEAKEADSSVGTNSAGVEANLVVHTTTVETVITVSESVVSVALDGQDSKNTETQKENGDSKPQPEDEDSKPQAVIENSKPQPVDEDSKSVQEDEVSKPKPEDEVLESAHRIVMPNTSAPDNQVSEVSPTLGSQVKSDSISTDSVSINEKIELKDNIIADNVKLELDVVKPEMVEPSSSNVDPVGGESHPMDVEEPHENKTSVEAKDGNNAANADMSKKIDTVDVGYSEKLNLDRSSGDDSMEEDVVETTKHIDSKYNSDDVVDKNEKTEPVANEETPVDVVGDDLSLDKDIRVESTKRTAVPVLNEESSIATPAEKRKHNDQEAVGSSEPLKRQRRWNSESVKVPESQSLNPTTPTTTPKDAFHSTSFKRSFSISDSKTNDDAPKERVVPPSQKPPTNSLRIDRFLRPFTLKAVQELLGKTGTVSSFWMDQIKTHCYVTYSSVEEATETRNAVYNLQWPPNGGRLLVAEFVEPQEVKMRVDGLQSPATPVSTAPVVSVVPPAAQPPMPSPRLQAPSLRQPAPRQQPLPPPPPPPSSLPPAARERLPPPPPLPTPHDPPIVTLDDLFRKTRATPRIYYLPLSEEQVAAKLAAKGKKPLL